MSIYLLLCAIIAALAVTMLFPNLAWKARRPFLFTNRLQWLLAQPFRRAMRNPRSRWPRRWFLILMPFTFLCRLIMYIILIPLRFLNAVYFDIILFLPITIRNGLMDLFIPGYSPKSRWRYTPRWLLLFPWRLLRLTWKLAVSVLQSAAMTAFDLVWHTLTLFHGTTKQVAGNVAHTGVWSAGSGDHAGTGVYFGLEERVARHYSKSAARSRSGEPCVIVARVTLTPCRPAATLPRKLRQAIGHDGDSISSDISHLWASLEYWRSDMNWYEFCIIQKSKHGFTRLWRVRPICLLSKMERPERVRWGLVFWPRDFITWALLFITLFMLFWIVLACIQYSPIWQGFCIDGYSVAGDVLQKTRKYFQ